MNAYRLSLGIGLGFFFPLWQAAVGVGWLFGFQPFFATAALAFANHTWRESEASHMVQGSFRFRGRENAHERFPNGRYNTMWGSTGFRDPSVDHTQL